MLDDLRPPGNRPGPLIWIERNYLALVLAVVGIAGICYGLWVPHGLPYDEPSHWNTVRWYGAHWSMPVLGDPGITYTAEHPPLSYLWGGLVQRLVQGVGLSSSAQLTAVRIVFGTQLLSSIVILDRILYRLHFPRMPRAIGLLLFGLAPVNLAIFWSVQNDGLLVLVGFAVMALALRWRDQPIGDGLSTRRAVVLGCLLGVALLVKITAAFLVVAVLGWFVWSRVLRRPGPDAGAGARRGGLADGIRMLAAVVVPMLVVAGWWFVWNFVKYGQITGSRMHVGLPAPVGSGVNGVSTVTHLVRGVATYLWVPNEYYRNELRLGPAGAAVVASATLALLGGITWAFLARRRERSALGLGRSDSGWTDACGGLLLVCMVTVVSLVGWALLNVFVEAFPARIGITGLTLISGAGGALAACRLRRDAIWVVFLFAAALLIAGSVWTVVFAHRSQGLRALLMA